MLSSLTTKLALKKIGLPSNALDFSKLSAPPLSSASANKRDANGSIDDGGTGNWGSWMSVKSLPLTVHPWFSPPPPPVAVGPVPRIGDVAPRDRQRKLALGGGRRVLLVFLRCVGCAFAQNTFVNLRTLANRYSGTITCIAVSHSSEQATRKWVDLLGGSWNVQVVIDEDRSVYAAWGLGVGGVWHLFNPTTQLQGWRETGWLGEKVAGAIQKGSGAVSRETVAPRAPVVKDNGTNGYNDDDNDDDDAPSTVMGNKWQEAGAFAIDGKGRVIWGDKALRADDLMNLEEGAKLLAL